MTPLRQETIYVHPHGTSALQNGRRNPRLAATLYALLEVALQPVLLPAVRVANIFGQKAEAADSGFHFAHALKIFQLINAAREVMRQLNLPINYLSITLRAKKLERHPDFQRIEAARAQLSVAEEVKLYIVPAAIFAQVFRRDVEAIAQYARAFAH